MVIFMNKLLRSAILEGFSAVLWLKKQGFTLCWDAAERIFVEN